MQRYGGAECAQHGLSRLDSVSMSWRGITVKSHIRLLAVFADAFGSVKDDAIFLFFLPQGLGFRKRIGS